MTIIFKRFPPPVAFYCLLAMLSQFSGAQERPQALSATEAISLVIQKVKADSLYENRTTSECLSFLPEETAPTHFDIAVREKHAGQCPGDPDTAPVVDRFRVLRATSEILRYDFLEDEYVAYDRSSRN